MADETNRGAANGPDDADEAFWERLSERLMKFARQRGLSIDDAGDVVQEALRDALQGMRRDKFSGSGTREGWVYGIFSHKLADFQRRTIRSEQRMVSVDVLAESAERSLVLRGPERNNPEDIAMVQHALAQLPPRQRAALILNSLFGLAAREFAPLLGVRHRAASEILTRAKERFGQIGATRQKTDPLKRLKK